MIATFKSAMLPVHRWTGLTVGLVLVFLALTGLTLVFRPQLAPLVERELQVPSCATPIPLDDLIGRARAAYPEGQVRRIEIGAEQSAVTMVRFSDGQGVFVDPCSGDVVQKRRQWGGLFGTLEQLHRFRFLDVAPGNFITGGTALVTALVLVAIGLFVWWPSTLRALRNAITLRTHLRGRALDLNLHRTVGAWTSLVILLVTLTSLPLAFVWVRDAIDAVVSSPHPEAKPKTTSAPDGVKPLPMGDLWQRVQAVTDHPVHATMEYARKRGEAVEVYLVERSAPHPNAYTFVYLDPYTGAILRHVPYATSSLGNKIYRWCASIHMGYVGGVFGQLLQFLGVLGVPVLGYSGISSYLRRRFASRPDNATLRARVAAIRMEAVGVKSFELVSAGGKALPPFTPGSHISVRIDEGLLRQYSLSNSSAERNRYVIAVKREPGSRGGSAAMHERVAAGDVLSISIPRNHFPLDESARHHVLYAAGIGITPLLCMARHLQAIGRSFELHYFTRSIEHTAFHEELSQPAFRGKIDFHYAVEPAQVQEYLHRLLWRRPDGAHLYLCGPRPFMEAVEAAAASAWPPETVHLEYFAADPMASAGPSEPFEIRLARTGVTYTVPAGRNIISVLAEQGIPTTTSCAQGVCGTCLTGVLEGTPDHRDAYLSAAERKSCDKIMLCVSRAKTPHLVLDL